MSPRSLRLVGDPPETVGSPPAPFFAKGFRPFFLVGSVLAAVLVPLWVLALSGAVTLGGRLDPVTWHAHEMVFGFAAAVIAGFLLTAAGNWTQRETATGVPLAALVVLWVAGRVALFTSTSWIAVALDLAFLPAVALAVGRPIVAAKSRRNFVMVAMLLLLAAANAAVHFGAEPRRALLAGVDIVTVLMVVIAGRVVPMFTKNATRIGSIRSVPALDIAAALAVVLVLGADVFAPVPRMAEVAVFELAAILVAARTLHWGTRHAFRDPLLWILHVGHAWIAVGLALRPFAPSPGLHAITAGAVGALTLGMMARVALGHTGRALVAPPSMTVAFVLVTVGTALRVAGIVPASAVLWALAFLLYAVTYAPILVAPRADGKPG
jgi:uncharacterized protein involved in response to NO